MAAEKNQYFTEKQISHILKEASELQAAAGADHAKGLSQTELQEIALELGIEARYVEAALAAYQQDDGTKEGYQILGGPTSIDIERVVEGEVSMDQWDELTTTISRTFNIVGQASQVGQSLQWTAQNRFQQVHVSLKPQDGKTKIRIFAKYTRLALLTHLPLTIMATQGFALPLAAGWSGLNVFLMGMLIVGTMHFILRFGFSRVAAHKRKQAEAVLREIEHAVKVEEKPVMQPQLESTLPDMLLDGMEAMEQEASAVRRRERS